jgi:hypothetical protein
VPNLFLTWYVSEYDIPSNEITVTSALKEQFLAKLSELDITFEFVVGAWGNSLIVIFPCRTYLIEETFIHLRSDTVLGRNIFSGVSSSIYLGSSELSSRPRARSIEENLFWSRWGNH